MSTHSATAKIDASLCGLVFASFAFWLGVLTWVHSHDLACRDRFVAATQCPPAHARTEVAVRYGF